MVNRASYIGRLTQPPANLGVGHLQADIHLLAPPIAV
jgi:hypothetical protein